MQKIALITGSRAEYGLLEPLARAIHDDTDTELCLIVTGSHLSPHHGMTVKDITLPIAELIYCVQATDEAVGTVMGASLAMQGFERAFRHHKPNAVIVLGDRWEILAGVIPAYMMGIPVVHLHGGDITRGSLDDGYRDCITRLSSLHLVSNDNSMNRVGHILGPWPYRYDIINVGALREDLSNVRPDTRYDFVALFHPSVENVGLCVAMAMKVLQGEKRGLFIKSNVDAGAELINAVLISVKRVNNQWEFVDSLPRYNFLSYLAGAKFIIGNSSSGITEAPALGTPTINIGTRQDGRLRASSVIDCDGTEEGIRAALEKLESKEFQESLKHIVNPYAGGMTAGEILGTIKEWMSRNK